MQKKIKLNMSDNSSVSSEPFDIATQNDIDKSVGTDVELTITFTNNPGFDTIATLTQAQWSTITQNDRTRIIGTVTYPGNETPYTSIYNLVQELPTNSSLIYACVCTNDNDFSYHPYVEILEISTQEGNYDVFGARYSILPDSKLYSLKSETTKVIESYSNTATVYDIVTNIDSTWFCHNIYIKSVSMKIYTMIFSERSNATTLTNVGSMLLINSHTTENTAHFATGTYISSGKEYSVSGIYDATSGLGIIYKKDTLVQS